MTLKLHPDALAGPVRSAAAAVSPGDGMRVDARACRRASAAGAPSDTVEVAVRGTARFMPNGFTRQTAAPPLAAPRQDDGTGVSMVGRFAKEPCGVLEVVDGAGLAPVIRLLVPPADSDAAP